MSFLVLDCLWGDGMNLKSRVKSHIKPRIESHILVSLPGDALCIATIETRVSPLNKSPEVSGFQWPP
jgi:hypothetical protein